MPRIVACLLVLTLAAHVAAAQDILFSADFEDGTADGFADPTGQWAVADGKYVVAQTGFEVYSWAYAGGAAWTDYTATVRMLALGSINQIFAVRTQADGDCYVVNLRAEPFNDLNVVKRSGGTYTVIASTDLPNQIDVWHVLDIRVEGSTISVDVDGQPGLVCTDTWQPFLNGGIAAASYTGGITQYQKVLVDKVTVTGDASLPATEGSWSGLKALFR